MPLILGSTDIDKLMLGDTPIDRLMLGTEEVWSAAPPPGGAVNFFSAGQKYTRSASGLNLATTGITWCAWAKLDADHDFYGHVLASDDANSHYCLLGVSSGGTNLYLSNGGSTAFDFTPGVWTFIAVTIDRTMAEDWIYYATDPATTLTRDYFYGDVTSHLLDTNTFTIGNDGFGSMWWGSIAAVKIWNAVLPQADLTAEAAKYAPVRTSNLWASYSFSSGPNTLDESGNGRTLIMSGTPALDPSGPPCT